MTESNNDVEEFAFETETETDEAAGSESTLPVFAVGALVGAAVTAGVVWVKNHKPGWISRRSKKNENAETQTPAANEGHASMA